MFLLFQIFLDNSLSISSLVIHLSMLENGIVIIARCSLLSYFIMCFLKIL